MYLPSTQLLGKFSNNYLAKVNNRNTRARCYICSKLTPCSRVSIVNFGQVNAGWELLLVSADN